jgi:hypothetical protein
MQDLTVKRTLVKSPPELWSELSEVERLAKHLDAFGEIKITRLEPERAVAWEGEGASGTVSIEPSGWGTKVTLTARVEGEEPAPPEPEPAPPEPEPEPPAPEPEPVAAEPSPEPVAQTPRAGLFARLFGRERRRPALAADAPVWVAGAPEAEPVEPEPVEPEPVEPERVEPEPVAAEPEPQPDPEPEPAEGAPLTPTSAQAALESALEALGSAHHRPFSRG